MLSRKTTRALTKYGMAQCVHAFAAHHLEGEGASTIGFSLGLTTRQADAAIDAGREYLTEQWNIETEMLTSSVPFTQYIRAMSAQF